MQIPEQELNSETLTEAFWSEAKSEERENHIKLMLSQYERKLAIFSNHSDQCFKMLGRFISFETYFKSAFISVSLVLVIVNVLASLYHTKGFWPWPAPILAALVAGASAIESHLKLAEKIEAFRHLRGLYLNAVNTYDYLWKTFVTPHGYGAKACINSQKLLSEINEKDEELLAQVAEKQNALLRKESK